MSRELEPAVEPHVPHDAVDATAAGGLRATVGLWQGVALYAGSVLGTGVLVLPAIAAETAGPASILAWAVLILLSAPMALTYAALCVQRPDAGGFSDAIERAFGARWGGVAGWLFLAQVPTGTVVVAQIAGHYGASAFGGGESMAGALGLGLVTVAYALNFVGLRLSATAQMIALGTIVVGLVLVVAVAAPEVDSKRFVPLAPHGYGAVGMAAVQLFWAFVGWEAITPLAKEFRRPRDLWTASVLAVIGVGVVYLALAVVTVGTGAYGASLAGTETPLVFLSERVFGARASQIVGVAGLVLCFIPLNAYVAGTSRLVFALGERGQLPRSLGVVSASGTPRRAVATLAVVCVTGCAIALGLRIEMADMLPYSTSVFIATYVLSMAAAVRLLRAPMKHLAAVSLVVCVGMLWFVGPLLLWVAAVTVASLAYQRWLTPKRVVA